MNDYIKEISDFRILLKEQTPKLDVLWKEPVPVWIKTNKLFLLEFCEFAKQQKNAAGLAANQVSYKNKRIDQRFFVHRIGKEEDCPFEIIIDPIINEYIGNPVSKIEGCLSWPECRLIASRFLKIKVSYWSIDGENIKDKEFEGWDAQVFQHETDHLNGVEEKIESVYSPIHKSGDKVGRNDLCPCGSSKKYKKCCGK